jgi:hypothetical protein
MAKRKPPKAETVASGSSEHVPEIHMIGPGEIRFTGQSSLDSNAEAYYQKWIKRGRRPGPESSRGLVRDEAQRRLNAGDFPETLKEFANGVSRWLGLSRRQGTPQMRPAVVERHIRDLWRRRPRRRP